MDINQMVEFHKWKGAAGSVAAIPVPIKDARQLGIIEVDENWKIIGFQEKPEYVLNVSMGVYVLNRQVLKYVPKNKPFGFDDLMHILLKEKKTIKVFPYDGYWLDIGRPDDYEKANEDIEKNKLLKGI